MKNFLMWMTVAPLWALYHHVILHAFQDGPGWWSVGTYLVSGCLALLHVSLILAIEYSKPKEPKP